MSYRFLPISLKMAWRETRGSWHQFVFFLVCVAIGVGSVVGVVASSAGIEIGGDEKIRTLVETDQSLDP